MANIDFNALAMSQEEYLRRRQMEEMKRQMMAQQGLYVGPSQVIGMGGQAAEKQSVPMQKQDPKHLNPKLLLTRKA